MNFIQSLGQNSRKIVCRTEVASGRRVTGIVRIVYYVSDQFGNIFVILALEHRSIKGELLKEP